MPAIAWANPPLTSGWKKLLNLKDMFYCWPPLFSCPMIFALWQHEIICSNKAVVTWTIFDILLTNIVWALYHQIFQVYTQRYEWEITKKNGHKTVECYDFIYAVLLSVCPKCLYPSRGSFSEHKFNPSVESWNESLKNFLRSGTKIIPSLEPHELDIG